MLGFLRIFCLVGLPIFAIAGCSIWKPVRAPAPARSVALRIAWTIVALIVLLPLFPLACWPIWKPAARSKPTADRVAWTIVALGVSLMATMALHAIVNESEGTWRSWETIRLHTRIFLALSIIPVAGPLVVYLVQGWGKKTSL